MINPDAEIYVVVNEDDRPIGFLPDSMMYFKIRSDADTLRYRLNCLLSNTRVRVRTATDLEEAKYYV